MKKLMASSEPGLTWWFALTIRDEIIRKMNREQYYKAMSWVRLCRRIMHQHIPKPPEIKWA